MSPAKLPPKCDHCGAREPLEPEVDLLGRRYCLDFDACVARRPLAGSKKA